jgi:hypothetical protein
MCYAQQGLRDVISRRQACGVKRNEKASIMRHRSEEGDNQSTNVH